MEFFEHALTLQPGPTTFDMDLAEGREQLASSLWRTVDFLGESSMAAANSALTAVLETLLRNTYRGGDSESSHLRTMLRVESILVDLQRAQSQKRMPLLTARFSCACLRAQLPRSLWDLFSLCFPGLLASHTWTEEFVQFASCRRPPCNYEELPLVGGVMFDNYQRKIMYSSKVTSDSHGFLLDMTNWATMRIPRILANQHFDANELCEYCAPLPAMPCHMPQLSSASCRAQGRALFAGCQWPTSPPCSMPRMLKSNPINDADSFSSCTRQPMAHS